MNFSPGLRGGNQLAGGSLRTVAAILIRIQAEREGGDFVLVCVSTILYHVHFSRAARGEPFCWRLSTNDCGGFGLHTSGTGGWGFRFSVFQHLTSQRIGLPSCAGGTGLPAALYLRLRRFLFAYKKNGTVGILFWCVSTVSYHVPFSRGARGAPACRQLSTHGCGGYGLYTSGTGRWGFGFGMFKQFYTMSFLPSCAEDTRLPVALFSRWQ